MILSAHQPCYLPWLGYFNKIYNSDVFVILDDVQFEKGSYTNRVQIKGQNGAQWLTIPIKQKMGQKIIEVEIVEHNWRDRHAKTLKQNYGKARWFPGFKHLTQVQNKWSEYLFRWLLCQYADSIDLFFPGRGIHLSSLNKLKSSKQELIIDLCKGYKADTFLFGSQGCDYVDIDYFKSEGITPIFQDFKCLPYPQQWGGDFIPGLSVIDALFNVGPERTLELIKGGFNV